MSTDERPEADVLQGAAHPRLTQTLYGHSNAEHDFLEAYNSDRLHHAWMVTGPKGIGKATLAWKIAKFVLSQPEDTGMFQDEKPNTLTTDPEHPVARRINALGEPNLYLARRPWDEKAKRLKTAVTVEEIRKLKSFFTLSAADGGWRVAIIDSADELNTAASNALLKVLEEPPKKVLLILICHQPSRLLPTIRSRCRTLRCDKLGSDDLRNALEQSEFEITGDARSISVLADGSVGDSIELLTNNGVALYQSIVQVINGSSIDRDAALKIANACVGKTAQDRYALTIRLIHLFISRLAKFGVHQPDTFSEAANGEAQVLSKLSPNIVAAQNWAQLSQVLTTRVTHANAVNLDPSSVILDMFLKIEETARG